MKRKVYLELGITLLVGFLIGFFVNSLITNKRIEDFSAHKGEMMFWRRALNEIEATQDQKQIIFPIIKDYSEETREILQESWKQLPPLWKEMENKIMQELTPDQQKQIRIIKEEHKSRKSKQFKNMQGGKNRNMQGNRNNRMEKPGERRHHEGRENRTPQ